MVSSGDSSSRRIEVLRTGILPQLLLLDEREGEEEEDEEEEVW